MRTKFIAEVLKDGHLSFPDDIKQRLRLHEGMKIKVIIEDLEKAETKKKKEAALKYLFSQEVDFSSWENEKAEIIEQRTKEIEAIGH